VLSGFGHSHARTALIFDIGGGSVGVALVRYTPHAVPDVLFFKRREYLFLENLAYDRFVVSMTEALEGLVQDIEASLPAYHGAVRDVVVMYASPWYVAETRLIHDAKSKPFLVTQGYLDSLSKEAVKQFHGVHDVDPRYGDLKLLEDSLIQIRLNGYSTLSPVGKSTQTVDAAFFLSGMSDMLQGRVKKIIDRVFPHAARHSYAITSCMRRYGTSMLASTIFFLCMWAERCRIFRWSAMVSLPRQFRSHSVNIP
jgi:hypothetical protein